MSKGWEANKTIFKQSIQWLSLHYKLIVVVGLCYLGMDKIIEDLPFYNPLAINMIHTLRTFSFQEFLMNTIENMLLLFLLYVMITAVTMTLNQRPLTINAISIALGRKRKEIFVITFLVSIIISILSMVLSSLILWFGTSYWLSEFFIIFATATFSLFFIFLPHELLFKNKTILVSLIKSFKIGKKYYFQLLSMIFFVGFIHSFINMGLSYVFLSSNYFYIVLRALNKFGLIIIISTLVTIFYYKLDENSF